MSERFDRSVRGFDRVDANPIATQASANYAKNPIPQIPASQFQVRGGLLFAGAGNHDLWSGQKLNFMPRFGVAYRGKPADGAFARMRRHRDVRKARQRAYFPQPCYAAHVVDIGLEDVDHTHLNQFPAAVGSHQPFPGKNERCRGEENKFRFGSQRSIRSPKCTNTCHSCLRNRTTSR